MNRYENRAVELLLDSMNQGVLFLDEDRTIRMCNQRLKEFTGIVVNAHASHRAGRIEEGNIVIIADNRLGEDDGNLGAAELSLLNIEDKDIKPGDMLIAVGVYKNRKIEPVYKYFREHQLNVPMKLDINYYGFHITASIDTAHREITITVNEQPYRMKYFSAVGNAVVIDDSSGDIKFFQAKGDTIRNEGIGELLRGQPYLEKDTEAVDVDVIGKNYFDLFDESEVSERLLAALSGESEGDFGDSRIYEINQRPFLCNIIPWNEPEEESGLPQRGVFLVIRAVENLETLLRDRNEMIRQVEEQVPETAETEKKAYPEDAFESFVGKSSRAEEVKYMAYKASRNKFNVIITGESGTGKSMLAREIHRFANPGAPFIEVNCNAIAPTLFESELFGYVGGAFTGARSDGKTGFFEAADKGTIFLDEIGEIPLDIQVKLLHVLQNKIIYRVGSSKPVKVDVRVIAATNKNLEEEVAQGRFRQDLFYRINVFPIDIPPIRERKGDLYLLINKLLKRTCDIYGLETKQFSGEALQKLISYNWPGNVRELENAIERAVTLCETNIIYPEHLRIGKGEIPTTMKEMLAKEEARILEMTLLKYNGDKQLSMKELDMSKTIFYDKLKRYGIK